VEFEQTAIFGNRQLTTLLLSRPQMSSHANFTLQISRSSPNLSVRPWARQPVIWPN